ncbi:bifunctional GNAT family N-acetyltransferase/carbon-nitrogen hydrolase family protein [Alkalilimnicola sp. S0819]|uniref:bifunctional GNAT family N-acetyltransferase/carbon-nitrogen hydrolase family protein n=1 Tax=Alkalilimnicola sp. S0819 TaxID=2613922 RepID=UPI0012621002|nr:bifunctional GNAT family N-acetyltransferase/carbon-nitrogen hydrolase family protein [Alkalilimnicola sp. S0819]KAB7623717.1 GNAT family N-acetyltransferase [Alkalilimnicola sp. S0819]MPQ16846.1 GNAT family N-acetyltransferase [Alkalilimnicola sp. S0819]
MNDRSDTLGRDVIDSLEGEEHHLKLRNLRLSDYEDVRHIMNAVYKGMGGAWTRKEFAAQINRFPEGQICIEDNGRVVAGAISLIVNYRRYGDQHTYDKITGNGTLSTHDPDGDVLYGVDVFVDPEYRHMRLGRRLYDARKELCRQLNLRSIVAGGRIPGYERHAAEISPEEYIDLVRRQEIHDPILSFQLANDFHVRRIIRNYIPDDDASRGYATLVQWNNIFYEENKPLIAHRKTVVRVGTVQWQMRRLKDMDDLLQQAEFFVDALAGYNCDFALFPEFFNAPLLAEFNQENPAEAIRGMAQYTDEIRDAMLRLAVNYNINIIAGSMPVYRDQSLYNVSYLLRRDGTMDHQYKLHVTPDERSYWGMQGGDGLRVFDTDIGKIGILVCYDVQFPELSRLLNEQGMQILFVPFWTDTKNGYQRVRLCSQARAVENECYVAITGSVGNLPKIENIDIQYSQTAVFSPSDFAFPHDAIVAEGTPNTEMTLIVDLDLNKLTELRQEGSVRNYQDRRPDLYRVDWHGPGDN